MAYLEKKDVFFPILKAFMRARATAFEMPQTEISQTEMP